jgi:DNA-binding transcriptional ArsR family regulator
MREDAFRSCRLFKALGNPLRYKILTELALSPRTPTELARLTSRPLPAVSRALSILHNAGLVHYKTQGHRVIYSIRQRDAADILLHGEAYVRNHGIEAHPPVETVP